MDLTPLTNAAVRTRPVPRETCTLSDWSTACTALACPMMRCPSSSSIRSSLPVSPSSRRPAGMPVQDDTTSATSSGPTSSLTIGASAETPVVPDAPETPPSASEAAAALASASSCSSTGISPYISREAAAATRTFRVEVAIPNSDLKIPAGMTAEVTLRAEPVSATILPRSVVTLSGKGDLGIRAVGPDGVVSFYPIDIVDDMPHALALGGIPKDARIIVAGQDLVKEGDKVRAVEADAATLKKLAAQASGGETE